MTREKKSIRMILVAAGGHAAEVLSYVEDLKRTGEPIELLGVVDDGKPAGPWESTTAVGSIETLPLMRTEDGDPVRFLVCVGSNPLREMLAKRMACYGRPWTLIHPSAQVGRSTNIGAGTLLAPNVVVTTRTTIGSHCILNAKASVHHDCEVGNFVNLNPGVTVCGWVKIGDGANIGAGATVLDRRRIGTNSVIGAGAVVNRDIPDNVIAFGVPARVIRSLPPEKSH